MLLSEALTRLKNLKSKAARVEKYINESAVHYEDEIPQYDYEGEMVNRAQLNEEILTLKVAIQKTNANTKVKLGTEEISLGELILRNAQLRTELAFISKQMEHSTSEVGRWGGERTKDHVAKKFAKGCDKVSFKRQLDALEKRKEEVEGIMAAANTSTPLIEG